jgi:3-oxoacyl-(acyl-carrier-protein) synthase/aryl carrier-like protein
MNEAVTAQLREAVRTIQALRARVAALQAERSPPVAVVGMACRFAGADDPAGLWRVLAEGIDTVRPTPSDRWDNAAWHSPDPDAVGRIAFREAAFLEDVDSFDNGLFGIAAREAAGMDPQHRLLLELAWSALEDAAIRPDGLAGSASGVFLGLNGGDHMMAALSAPERVGSHALAGAVGSIAAGRIAYAFGLTGPAMVVDTACSSSLVAVHLAVQALRRGECTMALAGGAHLMLAPNVSVALSRARMMAPDGRCKVFDASADGFGQGEGGGIVVLKRLADAQAAGERVLAVITGSALNQDGRSAGITAPNQRAQEAVIRAALADAGVGPEAVDAIEAHGTGTALGDPLELHALASVFRGRSRTLPVGSVKASIGHTAAAAGVAGLIKAVLMLQAQAVPPVVHFRRLNPHVSLDGVPIQVPAVLQPASLGCVGVSSFGFSGTNAHVVLRRWEEAAGARVVDASGAAAAEMVGTSGAAAGGPGAGLLLSARSPEALRTLIERTRAALADGVPFADACHTVWRGRARFGWWVWADSAAALETAEPQRGPIPELPVPAVARLTELPRPLFERQRFARLGGAGAAPGALYPGRLIDTPSADRQLECVLDRQAQPWLGDHRVQGRVIVPGAVMIALLLSVGQQGELADIRFPEPVVLEDVPVRLVALGRPDGTLSVGSRAGGRWTWHATARTAPRPSVAIHGAGGDGRGEPGHHGAGPSVLDLGPVMDRGWETHAGAGSVGAAADGHARPGNDGMGPSGSDAGPPAQTVPPSAWQGATRPSLAASVRKERQGLECPHAPASLSRSDWTAHLAGLGITIGPVFQGIASIATGPTTTATVDDAVLGGPVGGPFHPALLDAVLQVAGGTLAYEPVLPVGIERLVLHGPLAGSLAVAAIRSGEAIDLTVHTTDGCPIATVSGLAVRRLADSLPPVVAGLAWRPAPGEPGHQAPEVWEVTTPRTDLAEALARVRWALGEAAPQASGTAPDRGRGHPGRSREAVPARDAATPIGGPAHAEPTRQPGDEPGRSRARAGGLVFLTSGAAPPVTDPAAAAFAGLASALAVERPELGCRCIDIGPGTPDVLVERELGSVSTEPVVALRPEGRFVPRLVPIAAGSGALQLSGTVLITGGAGGIGRHTAEWAKTRGAGAVLLVGRTPPDPVPEGMRFLSLDIAADGAVDTLRRALADLPPLRSVVHTAGVLRDGLITDLTSADFDASLAPKLQGAWTLHTLTERMELDHFLLFGSVASLIGAAGQANYAAANATLDAFAQWRRGQGLPATSIAWGRWAGIGMAAGLSEAQTARVAARGLLGMTPARALAALDTAVLSGEAVVMIAALDLPRLAQDAPPVFAGLLPAPVPDDGPFPAQVAALVAQILGQEAAPGQPLVACGLDSLMAMDLRNRLNRRFGVTLGLSDLMGGADLDTLTRTVERALGQAEAMEEETL